MSCKERCQSFLAGFDVQHIPDDGVTLLVELGVHPHNGVCSHQFDPGGMNENMLTAVGESLGNKK